MGYRLKSCLCASVACRRVVALHRGRRQHRAPQHDMAVRVRSQADSRTAHTLDRPVATGRRRFVVRVGRWRGCWR